MAFKCSVVLFQLLHIRNICNNQRKPNQDILVKIYQIKVSIKIPVGNRVIVNVWSAFVLRLNKPLNPSFTSGPRC